MIKSAAKKKIEAIVTITNTMMVVMVVSRRVGQVTLAASERTSCRNLNGLKAILSIHVRHQTVLHVKGIRTADIDPALVGRMSRENELDCSGEFLAAPDIRLNGPAAGGGYLLPERRKVKDDRPLRHSASPVKCPKPVKFSTQNRLRPRRGLCSK